MKCFYTWDTLLNLYEGFDDSIDACSLPSPPPSPPAPPDSSDEYAEGDDIRAWACDMKNLMPAFIGLLSMAFIFLLAKIGVAIVVVAGPRFPPAWFPPEWQLRVPAGDAHEVKVINISVTVLSWVFLLACWALFVDKRPFFIVST